MKFSILGYCIGIALAAAAGTPALAQPSSTAPDAARSAATNQPTSPASDTSASAARDNRSAAKAPDSLNLFFATGSADVSPAGAAVLDHAARLYRDGQPIVMIVTGETDAVGSASSNLALSEARANAVVHGLVARGIPADRFQIHATGETQLAVPTRNGVADAQNRRVEITWR